MTIAKRGLTARNFSGKFQTENSDQFRSPSRKKFTHSLQWANRITLLGTPFCSFFLLTKDKNSLNTKPHTNRYNFDERFPVQRRRMQNYIPKNRNVPACTSSSLDERPIGFSSLKRACPWSRVYISQDWLTKFVVLPRFLIHFFEALKLFL